MQKYQSNIKKQNSNANLDTLALVSSKNTPETQKLQGRLKTKFITNQIVMGLVDLDSPLKKSYWNTWHCNNSIFVDNGKLHTKYCKNRWCLTCARIKTATYINHYLPTIETLPDLHLVTLTGGVTIPKEELNNRIDLMTKTFRKLSNTKLLRGKIKGIRKLECTYNPKTNLYHPHFHLIVSHKEIAEDILTRWLNYFPDANRKGQDIRPCNQDTLKEVFKYVTKIIQGDPTTKKKKVYFTALDNILQTLKGRRTFQPYGIRKLELDEEFDVTLSDKANEVDTYDWEQEFVNWVSRDNGTLLIDYEVSETLIELAQSIYPYKTILKPPPIP
jgi:hypothetical protein